MSPAIKVENLSKRYRLGLTHSGSIRELVNSAASRLFRRKSRESSKGETSRVDDDGNFWALKDINFEINAGEVVGIIGRNGAGKSTLLKILSRITLPSSGRIEMRGRVASLLEVGTGFHPELTGRENVYMNGTILGMTKQEIARRFDAIVDFAGVETFIDTPVKRYSSGMTVRLGFAVAAHLEPEILIVDEVLAVGDAQFQKKCLGRMRQSAEEGRTVLFVSHQLAAIESLTTSCVLLQNGSIFGFGSTSSIVRQYLGPGDEDKPKSFSEWPEQYSEGDQARLIDLVIQHGSEKNDTMIPYGQKFTIRLEANFQEPMLADVAIVIENAERKPILSTHISDFAPIERQNGSATYLIEVSPNQLKPGDYLITTSISTPLGEVAHAVLHYSAFSIRASVNYDGPPMEKRWGDLVVPYAWSIVKYS